MIILRELKSQNKYRNEKYLPLSSFSKRLLGRALKYKTSDNLISAEFGNEVVLSDSGQAKMERQDSCLSLVTSDFVVF